MSLKIVKTPTSIKFASGDMSIAIIMKDGDLHLEQSLGSKNREVKSVIEATKQLRVVLSKKVDNKMNYLRRFSKVVSIVNDMKGVNTFRILANRFEKMPEYKAA